MYMPMIQHHWHTSLWAHPQSKEPWDDKKDSLTRLFVSQNGDSITISDDISLTYHQVILLFSDKIVWLSYCRDETAVIKRMDGIIENIQRKINTCSGDERWLYTIQLALRSYIHTHKQKECIQCWQYINQVWYTAETKNDTITRCIHDMLDIDTMDWLTLFLKNLISKNTKAIEI